MKRILAEIITIGDEILIGQITNTNSQWIASELNSVGIQVSKMTTIGDGHDEIIDAIKLAEETSDVIIITGGLGPTNDDVTKKCLASYFNTPLVVHEERLRELEAYFASRGKILNELNQSQALHPKSADLIPNPVGTAAGIWFNKENKSFISMPGVPFEMKKMVSDYVIPKLISTYKTPSIVHKTIKTVGISESELAGIIEPWENSLPAHIKLAYLPSLGQVRLRLSGTSTSEENLSLEINNAVTNLKSYIDRFIYGYDEISLEEAVGALLTIHHTSIATAESCTGGFLSHLITSIPGSSTYFNGGIIAYSNNIKTSMLQVSKEDLDIHGAVSEPVIRQMAVNVRGLLGADIGVATSGIAGPDGGTDEKPVGTVWIAIATVDQVQTKLLHLTKDRKNNILLTSIAVLNMIRQSLSPIAGLIR